MDKILWGTEEYAAAYLDNIVIYSQTWQDHLDHLKDVLVRIKNTGLTIRPDKCTLVSMETQYLGYVLGHGVICQQVGKVEAIKNAAQPSDQEKSLFFFRTCRMVQKFYPKLLWTSLCPDWFN